MIHDSGAVLWIEGINYVVPEWPLVGESSHLLTQQLSRLSGERDGEGGEVGGYACMSSPHGLSCGISLGVLHPITVLFSVRECFRKQSM